MDEGLARRVKITFFLSNFFTVVLIACIRALHAHDSLDSLHRISIGATAEDELYFIGGKADNGLMESWVVPVHFLGDVSLEEM